MKYYPIYSHIFNMKMVIDEKPVLLEEDSEVQNPVPGKLLKVTDSAIQVVAYANQRHV